MPSIRDSITNEAARPIIILDASGDQVVSLGGGDASAANQTSGNTKLDTIITLLGTSTASQVWKSYNSTSSIGAGSAAAVWTPGSGLKIAITHLTIATYGSTAARVLLYFAASGDQTYTAGTDQLVFAGSFAPSTSAYPGVVIQPSTPILAANADYILRYQNDAAISIDITVYGYEF